MMDQWNCGMMGLKKTEFKAHIFALIFCSDAVFCVAKVKNSCLMSIIKEGRFNIRHSEREET
jgi:hypothetical protein